MILVFAGFLIHYLIFRREEDIPVGKSAHPKREIWEVIALFGIIILGDSIVNYLAYCVKSPNQLLVDNLYWIKFGLVGGLLLFFVFIIERRKFSELGFKKPAQHVIWLSGIGLFIIWAIALWGRSDLKVGAFLLTVFEAPFLEEVIFRGFFQTNLERSLGSKKGFWIAVILFTVYHIPSYFWGWQAHHEISNVGESFVRLSASFLLALFFCNIYRKTRSLYPLMVIHFIANNHLANLYYLIF
jgi:membrane protease YdiL (CAAX protease family)